MGVIGSHEHSTSGWRQASSGKMTGEEGVRPATAARRNWAQPPGTPVGANCRDRDDHRRPPPHRSVRARLRIRLLPRMSSVEALVGIRMQNAGLRNPPVQQRGVDDPIAPARVDCGELTCSATIGIRDAGRRATDRSYPRPAPVLAPATCRPQFRPRLPHQSVPLLPWASPLILRKGYLCQASITNPIAVTPLRGHR